jgi:hypothetical protein
MHTTKISIELYEVYRAADAIASSIYHGLPITETLIDNYRKANDHWHATLDERVPDELPNRCREEGA